MTSNLIRDGQTRKAAIDKTAGLNDGLQFEYRPMLPVEFHMTEAAIEKLKAKPFDGVKVVAKTLADHVVSWSEVDADGKAVPITFDNWLRMPFPIIRAVYDIVSGYKPSDAIGDDADEEDERLQRLIESSTGPQVLEGDRKN